jgi:menaquinol-cytochrome c reductase iron-sulfur subunit
MHRRTLLKWAVNLVGAVVASVVAVPSIIAALSPALRSPRRGRDGWYALGPLDRFDAGEVVKATVRMSGPEPVSPMPEQAVYVWRVGSGDVIVFSMACTDLGCPVTYDPGSEFFYCPCHGGTFRKDGEPVAGPPARPLYRYATRLRGGVLEIDLLSVPPVA